MYRDSYQRGMLTIFFSCGSKPLNIWETHTRDGYITRFLDQDIKSMVLEIGGTNVSTTYMICPKGKQVLGITMPFLVMIVKNLKKYFSFEVTILDETGTRRRFRVSNFQSTTQILPLCTVMPIGLSDGWNQIQFNLAEFTRRAYQKQFVEVQKLKINANIRLRRVYFTERLIPEDQLPPEYKLYFPLSSKDKAKKTSKSASVPAEIEKENLKSSTSQQAIKQTEKPGSKASLMKEQAPQEKPTDVRSRRPSAAQPVEAPPALEGVEDVAEPIVNATTDSEEGQKVAEGEALAETQKNAGGTIVSEEPLQDESTKRELHDEPTTGEPQGEPEEETAGEPIGEHTGEPIEEPTGEPSGEPVEELAGEPTQEEIVGEPQSEPAAEPEIQREAE